MVDRIRYHPDPILRKRCKNVKLDTESVKRVLNMFKLMYDLGGIGLAAPQIGWCVRLFIAKVDGRELIFVNPVIIDQSDEIIWYDEACLSVPGLAGIVDRPKYIKVEAEDINGEKFVIEDAGTLARCIQHEIDHLFGILFIDKAEEVYFIDDQNS